MHRLRSFTIRILNIFRRSRLESDLREQLEAHREMIKADLIGRGMPPSEAEMAARRTMGNDVLIREFSRDEIVHRFMGEIIRDVRHAFRSLARNPGFATVAILTLGLAIGANTAIFSAFDTVILRPLPYRDADRLHVIHEVIPAAAATTPLAPVNALHFREWRAATHSFEEMALLGPAGYTLTGAGEPVRISGARATPNLFSMLGVEPALGRGFLEEEDMPGRDAVVILGHELWSTQFGGDPNVVGRTIRLDGAPHLVVGVLPANFRLPNLNHFYGMTANFNNRTQLWKPFAATPRDLRLLGSFNYAALARLKPGVSIASALDDLNAVQADLARRAPEPAEFRAALVPMMDQITGRSRPGLQLFLAVVSMVLFIASLNIANLLLVRGARRQREFAIRRATGGSRVRLVGQLLVEGLVLSTSAGLVAVAVSAALVRLIQTYSPVDVPRIDEVTLDVRSLFFTFIVTVGCGLAIGTLTAWRTTRTTPVELLRSSSATVASSAGLGRLCSILVGVEVAASTVCVIATVLLVSSYLNLMSVDRGFDVERILTVDVALPAVRYDTPDKGVRFLRTLVDRAWSMPGVESVGMTDALPLSGISASAIMVEGANLPRQQRPVAAIRGADPGYFRTLGIPLRAGRILEDRDADRRVAVVSTQTAERLWPHQDPLGKRFRSGPDDSPFVEVVGVVGDVRAVSLGEDPPLNIYLPISNFSNRAALAVKTASDPATVSSAIRALIRELDAELFVPTPRTMEEVVVQSVAGRRFQMNLVLLLAMAAVFLAGMGIYGVVSQALAQRTNEFGIRMALGADPGNISYLILRQGLLPVFVGLIGGIIGSLGIGRLLQNLLFEVSPTDLTSFVAASIFLVSIALLASVIPVWRASCIDPMAALRHE